MASKMAAKYFNCFITLYMTYKNTYNLQNSQALTILLNFIVYASLFTHLPIKKLFFLYFKRQKNLTETGILMIML